MVDEKIDEVMAALEPFLQVSLKALTRELTGVERAKANATHAYALYSALFSTFRILAGQAEAQRRSAVALRDEMLMSMSGVAVGCPLNSEVEQCDRLGWPTTDKQGTVRVPNRSGLRGRVCDCMFGVLPACLFSCSVPEDPRC